MELKYSIAVIIVTNWLGTAQSAAYTYDLVGDTYYFIGKGENESHYFDWFEQRQICWDHHGELIYGLTADKMTSLESYMLEKGYANGSVFATAGYSHNSISSFRWSTLGQPLTYSKWLPGQEPPEDCNLSLQLIDGELYMIRTWDFDQYYICEYRTNWRRVWIFFNRTSVFVVCMLLLCAVIIFVPCTRNKKTKDVESSKSLRYKFNNIFIKPFNLKRSPHSPWGNSDIILNCINIDLKKSTVVAICK